MSRKRLRKSDVRALSEELSVELSKKAVVEQDEQGVYVDGALWFFQHPETTGWVPSLKLLLTQPSLLPTVTVDMGAVRFVTRGADIMRPGIVSNDDFEKGALVAVVDETHNKPLAIGQALVSGEDMRSASEGRVVQNLHYVGDDLWG